MSTKATVSTDGHLIDPNCKYNTGSLVGSKGIIYDCTLNQTDINTNKNKFYIMQIIKNGSKYTLYIRYGRIGETGTISYKDFASENQAISFFEKQFRTKTGNSWIDKDNFERKNGKYFLTEIEHVDISEELSSDTADSGLDKEEDLDERVTELLKLISNTTYMKNTLVQLEIDTEKMPLGKISQNQIDEAYLILNNINKNLDNDKLLNELSSEFYIRIPYACGRRSPPIINTRKLVGKYVNLLNELSQMAYGSKVISKLKKDKNNMFKLYQNLRTEITPLEKSDKMYKILKCYINDSKGSTHHFNYKILDIFEINREFERDIYSKFTKKNKINNKMLLFHGSRISNTMSIFQNGLMCDLSRLGINVHISGKMYGLGIYTADSISKSIQYCAYDSSDNIACIFICEVALGNMLKKKQADPSLTANTLPKGYNSICGVGKNSYNEYHELKDGILIPKGTIQPIKENLNSVLLYDEFIVYADEQINLRYIIKLEIKNDNSDSE